MLPGVTQCRPVLPSVTQCYQCYPVSGCLFPSKSWMLRKSATLTTGRAALRPWCIRLLAATRKVYVASKAKEAYGSVLKLANFPQISLAWTHGKGSKGSIMQTRLCLNNAPRILSHLVASCQRSTSPTLSSLSHENDALYLELTNLIRL